MSCEREGYWASHGGWTENRWGGGSRMRRVVCRSLCTSMRFRSHGWVVGGGEKAWGQEVQEVQEVRCKRRSGCLGTHEDRYHLSNEALVLNGLGGHRKMREKGIWWWGKYVSSSLFQKKWKPGWSSDHDQAHTRFEGGTHENHTERNETSYGIRENVRKA